MSSSTRQVSAREVRSAQLPSRVLGALEPRPSPALDPAPASEGPALLSSGLSPARRRGRRRGRGGGAGLARVPPGSAAASPAGLAAGERLGPQLRPHGCSRLFGGVRLHPDSPGPADPGAAGQLQPGSALRGQAEAGGEQRPRGQEPADPGAGAADPGPEGPQFRGQR